MNTGHDYVLGKSYSGVLTVNRFSWINDGGGGLMPVEPTQYPPVGLQGKLPIEPLGLCMGMHETRFNGRRWWFSHPSFNQASLENTTDIGTAKPKTGADARNLQPQGAK